jgi:hypothetical protein
MIKADEEWQKAWYRAVRANSLKGNIQNIGDHEQAEA